MHCDCHTYKLSEADSLTKNVSTQIQAIVLVCGLFSWCYCHHCGTLVLVLGVVRSADFTLPRHLQRKVIVQETKHSGRNFSCFFLFSGVAIEYKTVSKYCPS